MREYVIIMAGTAIMSVIAEILSPENWKKYIKIVTGIIIACSIIQPAASFRNIELNDGIELDFEEEEADMFDAVMDEFCMKLREDIENRIYDECGLSVQADVKIKLNDEGLIDRVEKIYIYGAIPLKMREKLASIYGLEIYEVIIYE